MNNIYKNIVIILGLAISFSACTEEVILDLNTVGPIIVIEGKISNDSVPFMVRVTTTADYYSLNIPEVTNAFVTINGSDGSKDTLFHDSAGYYYSNFIKPCKVGIAYTLNVTHNGKTYSSTETCKPQNPVDSINVLKLPKRGFLPAGYYLFEYTTEKPGRGDSYQWEIYRNDTLLTDKFYFLADDQFLEESGQYLANDFQFLFKLGDVVKFEQLAVSRQYYNFLTAVQSQTNRDGSPFSAPPSNIGGNISNGGMGYFAVRNLIRKTKTVK